MNQLEDRITATLRDNAAAEVDLARLLDRARRRGRGYRTRRRALRVGGGTAVVFVAVLGATVAAPRLAPHHAGRTVTDASATSAAPTHPAPPVIRPASLEPPTVAGATPATVDPTVVGADPGLLHFDVPTGQLPQPVDVAQWQSFNGVELLHVQVGSGQDVEVQVTGHPDDLDPLNGATRMVRVGARSATAVVSGTGRDRQARVRWQPMTAVWAQVQVPGEVADGVRLAEAVRFDRVLRCAVPFQLAWVPPGATTEMCGTVFDPSGVTGTATVKIGTGAELTVDLSRTAQLPSPSTTINGRPALARQYPGDGGMNVMQVDIGFGDHVVSLLAEGTYDPATVLRIAQGYRDVAGTDPASWPGRPF